MFVDDNVLAAKALERWFATAPGLQFAGWADTAPDQTQLKTRWWSRLKLFWPCKQS